MTTSPVADCGFRIADCVRALGVLVLCLLITGADAGLVLSLVKRFLQGGFAVFAGAYRSMDVLNILALDYGDALSLIPLDVAELESVRAAARQVSERTDTLDIIITNAGIHLRNSQGPPGVV